MSSSLESLIKEQVESSDARVGADFLAYLVVGGIAVAGYVILSAGLMSLLPGVPAWIVSTGAYGVFVLAAYVAHWRYAFRAEVRHHHSLTIYLAIQALAMGLATVFSWLVYGVASMPTLPASVMVLLLTSGASFFALRIWAFDRRKGSRQINS